MGCQKILYANELTFRKPTDQLDSLEQTNLNRNQSSEIQLDSDR